MISREDFTRTGDALGGTMAQALSLVCEPRRGDRIFTGTSADVGRARTPYFLVNPSDKI
jgi:hypothetical protein